MVVRCELYDMRHGTWLARLPLSQASWQETWNAAGSMSVTIPLNSEYSTLDPDGLIVETKALICLMDGERIIHAGPVLSPPDWDPQTGTLSVSCGDGWSMFDWRLALDARLRDRQVDGEIVVDDDNPGPEWSLGFQGTVGDIIRGLILETQKWGSLPIVAMPAQNLYGGEYAEWTGWDLTRLSDAFADLLERDKGGQLRFDPEIVDGRFRWRQRWALDGVSTHTFDWNTLLPDQPVRFTGISGGGATYTQVWASGGKNDDKVLLTRADSIDLESNGFPLAQYGDASQSTDGSLAALHSFAKDTLAASRDDRTYKLQCPPSFNPMVGDRVHLRVKDQYVHGYKSDGSWDDTMLGLIITDISGSTDSQWLDLQARVCGEGVQGVRAGTADPVLAMKRRMASWARMTRKASSPSASAAYQTVGKIRQLRAQSTDQGVVTWL